MRDVYVDRSTSEIVYVGKGYCTLCKDQREYTLTREDYRDIRQALQAKLVKPGGQGGAGTTGHRYVVSPGSTLEKTGRERQLSVARKEMEEVFHSKVKPRFSRYRHREIQLDLAAHVRSTLKESRILAAEAGVGTGKTFAYLVPLLWSMRVKGELDGPVIISTKTNNLLDQLMHKDFAAISSAMPSKPQSSVFRNSEADRDEPLPIKGQSNYACLVRVSRASRFTRILKEQVSRWILESSWGERGEAEAPQLSEDQWEQITIEACLLIGCHEYDRCPYARLRSRLEYHAGVIITNHNLLSQNLWRAGKRHTCYWKDPAAMIVDEAHALEAAVRQQLSTVVSPEVFDEIAAVSRQLDETEPGAIRSVWARAESLRRMNTSMFQSAVHEADTRTGGDLQRFKVTFESDFLLKLSSVRSEVARLRDDADVWIGTRQRGSSLDKTTKRLINRLFRLADGLTEALDTLERVVRTGDRSYVAWLEQSRDAEQQLVVAPVHIGTYLRDMLWKKNIPVVLLSATLAVDGDLEPIANSLGLAGSQSRLLTFQRNTGFEYPTHMRIYVPSDLPVPQADEEDGAFTEAVKVRIRDLLLLSHGRALVLFTSHARMNAVHQYLSGLRLPFRVLVQRPGKVHRVLQEFAGDEHSVLLATGAFWEGVDVEGPSLSHVIIDKLPFPSPADPLVAAQAALAGSNSFERVFLPGMVTQLRQGAGRLIRSETDWGIVSLLDVRARMQHAATVTRVLPDAPWVDDLEQLKAWFDQKWQEGVR